LAVLGIESLLAGEADNERERKVEKSLVLVATGRTQKENSEHGRN